MSKKFPCAQKSQCPTTKKSMPHQILPQPKFLTCPYTTIKYFHSHAKKFLHFQDSKKKKKKSHKFMSMYNRKNSYISKIVTTKFFHDPTSHTQQKYFCSQNTISTKNFPYLQNFSILIPTKFCHKLHVPTNLPHSS